MNYKLDTDTHVYFYEQEFYVLSNFSSFEVCWGSTWFKSAEHLYHWLKFDWNYPNIRHDIINAHSAHHAFEIAQMNKQYRVSNWDGIKLVRMKQILTLKLQQHEYVRRKLLQTGDRILVEDSWRDSLWGWGPNKDGENLLGKLWMELRDDLRNGKIEIQ